MALQVLRALEGLKMMGKDQDRGLKVIPQTQRDLDRITRQVITAKKPKGAKFLSKGLEIEFGRIMTTTKGV